jgi:hypothetical protein
MSAPERDVIAIVEGSIEQRRSLSGFFCDLMLAVGFLIFLVFFFLEGAQGSAIREAALGAIWTGWNVLWGVGSLRLNARATYVVYRENTDDRQR